MLNHVGVVRGEKPGLYLSEDGEVPQLADSGFYHCSVAVPSRTSTFNVGFPNVETHTHSEVLQVLTCATGMELGTFPQGEKSSTEGKNSGNRKKKRKRNPAYKLENSMLLSNQMTEKQ